MRSKIDISDLLYHIGSYNQLIQVGYKRGDKYVKSGIMKVGNVTVRHLDRWTFRKHIGQVIPCVTNDGRAYLFINLYDD